MLSARSPADGARVRADRTRARDTTEYAELARAFDYGFGAMTAIALAGVDAAWLTAGEKAALRSRISTAAVELGSSIGSSSPA